MLRVGRRAFSSKSWLRNAAEQASTASQPKKSHGFLKFLVSTTVLGAGAYGGGVWFATQNDEFHDTFIQYVPFAEQAIYKAEGYMKQTEFEDVNINQPQKPAGKVSHPLAIRKEEGKERTMVVPGSGVRVSDVASKDVSSTMGEVEKARHEVSEIKSVVGGELKLQPDMTAGSLTRTPILDMVDVKGGADPLVQGVVDNVNEFIASINSAKFTDEGLQSLQAAVNELNSRLVTMRIAHAEELRRQGSELESRLASLYRNQSDKEIQSQREKLESQFATEKYRIETLHEKRLELEVAANAQAILQRAHNMVIAGSVEAERRFTELIAERVEQERNGRLAHIEELNATVDELTKFAETSGQRIGRSANVAKFHVAVSKLWSVLNTADEAVALQPYVAELRKYSVESDPVVESVLANISQDVLEEGVLTHAQLAARFRLLVPELRKASLLPPNAGVAGHIGSWLFSKLMLSKSGNPMGDDVESIFARAETALSEGRVVDAVAEVNSLKGWPKRLATDWLDEGRKRGEVEFLLSALAENAKLWT